MTNVSECPFEDDFKKIVFASDNSEFSKDAERLAVALALQHQGHLHVLRIVQTSSEYEFSHHRSVVEDQQMLQDLEGLRHACIAKGVSCSVMVRHGSSPEREMLAAIHETQADLLVMGRRGRRGLARMKLGHATAQMVGSAPCKVLVVPRETSLWERGILLATDGSPTSAGAGVFATQLARHGCLPLTVLSVIPSDHKEGRRSEARDVVDGLVAAAIKNGVQATGLVVEGQPEDVIIATAQEHQIDLIVGGSHGRTGLNKILLGSVMERVINNTHCPVLAVKQ